MYDRLCDGVSWCVMCVCMTYQPSILRTIDISDNNFTARGYGCLVGAVEACVTMTQVITTEGDVPVDTNRSLGQ